MSPPYAGDKSPLSEGPPDCLWSRIAPDLQPLTLRGNVAATLCRARVLTLVAWLLTTTCIADAGELPGIWKLIWVGLAKNSGAAIPFTVTEVGPNWVGSG